MTTLTVVVVADPLATLIPAHDSTVAMMEATQERGHRLLITTTNHLRVRDGHVVARCQPVRVQPARLVGNRWVAPQDWYTTGAHQDVPLQHADAVLMRTDPPVDAGFLRATYLLDQVDPRRTLLVNAPAGLRDANEKLVTLRFPHLIPDTIVTADMDELADTVHTWGQAVLKPTDAMAGRGILLLRPGDLNLRSMLETATGRGAVHVILQRYLAEAADGDRRVIVLDGQPVGAIRRLARDGEFRCNMAAGAAVMPDTVTPRDKEICDDMAPELERLGILLAGIDVIGDRLIEVNVTSPTGLREIHALTGSHLAHVILNRIEERCTHLTHLPGGSTPPVHLARGSCSCLHAKNPALPSA
jgi:glutathione synthase